MSANLQESQVSFTTNIFFSKSTKKDKKTREKNKHNGKSRKIRALFFELLTPILSALLVTK